MIVRKQPILAQHILILLGVISSYLSILFLNIENHHDKYIILDDVVGVSLKVISTLEA